MGWGDVAGRAPGCCDPWGGMLGGGWVLLGSGGWARLERGLWLVALATGQPRFQGGPGASSFLPATN